MEEIGECLADSKMVEETLEVRELAEYIEKFMDSLSRENRVIFMRRYWFADSYEAIAKRTGLTEKNVSVRLVRIRRQLQGYLTAQGLL